FFQAEDGIRDRNVTGVQTCALPISCHKLLLTVPAFGDGVLPAIAGAFGMLVSPDKPLRLSSRWCHVHLLSADLVGILLLPAISRSEERRVGKEWRSRTAPSDSIDNR